MTKERMALFGIIHTVHASFSSLIFLMLCNSLIRDTCNKHIPSSTVLQSRFKEKSLSLTVINFLQF